MVWEELEDVEELARAGPAGAGSRGRYAVHPRFGPQINLGGLGRGRARQLRAGRAARRARARRRADGSRGARAARDDPAAPSARAARARVRRGLAACGRATAWRPPPSTTTRPTGTGCSSTRLGVAQAVSAISATFPGIDRDVAVTGALLHDIGKLEAYSSEQPQSIDLTDAGRLHGEIALGYYRIRREIEDIDGFPERARAGGRAHHPLPPRLARARQPGRALHARGDARAHDRQPRRAPGQLRPAREGARARQPLVGVRPRDRRRRLLRRPRGDAEGGEPLRRRAPERRTDRQSRSRSRAAQAAAVGRDAGSFAQASSSPKR